MSLVYLARHGETTWNLAGRYQGRRESMLTSLGIRQGAALGAAIARRPPVARVVASPLLRCVATARFAADLVGRAVETDDRLIEIAHGRWEGRYRDEISRNDRERYRRWRSDPSSVGFEGGETLRDVQARWCEFAQTFDPRGDALVVTHDAVVRSALVTQAGRSLNDLWRVSVCNAGYAIFEVDGGRWTLREECVSDHIAGLLGDLEGQAL